MPASTSMETASAITCPPYLSNRKLVCFRGGWGSWVGTWTRTPGAEHGTMKIVTCAMMIKAQAERM